VTVGPTASPTATQATSARRAEDDDDKKPRRTEDQIVNEQHSNTGGRDQYHTEGHVAAVERPDGADYLLVTIALGPGGRERLIVQVPCLRGMCPDIRVGDYLEADGYQNGVGDPNTYFVAADAIEVWRDGRNIP
jgi:hypothetical protein